MLDLPATIGLIILLGNLGCLLAIAHSRPSHGHRSGPASDPDRQP